MLLTFGAVCLSAEARKVTGSVVSGEEKLSGVIVTDGKNFTQTNKKGKFSFEPVMPATGHPVSLLSSGGLRVSQDSSLTL